MMQILTAPNPPRDASDGFKAKHREIRIAGGTKWYRVKNDNPALNVKIPKNATMLVSDHGDFVFGEKSTIKSRLGLLDLRTNAAKGSEQTKTGNDSTCWAINWSLVQEYGKRRTEKLGQAKIHLLVLHAMSSRKNGKRTGDHLRRNHDDNRFIALTWATDKEQTANRGASA